MPKRPDIYELLAAQQQSVTSITQLNDATKSTYIDRSNVEFWQGVITVARAMKESRLYGDGIPIPEASDVETQAVADGAQHTIKPTSPEVWQLVSVSGGATIVTLTDGSNYSPLPVDSNGNLYSPVVLTPTLYLHFQNASGGSVTVNAAYHKLGL